MKFDHREAASAIAGLRRLQRVYTAILEHDPESVQRFSEKIMLNQKCSAPLRELTVADTPCV
ncbi:hypothetical protein [Bradyrhizobium sp. NP1]|uniref:hypothetical protein n=1 Tax=Bradyrhizobium sp. NP1 TaxID=3049772 RepID=UPI0025A66CB2|nr:hypothetical protein [Bradyrhizobium sp. NP1]WJR75179.1 hypothetical protein QOU61_20420 [Bradyrhizobium sp. NP1]